MKTEYKIIATLTLAISGFTISNAEKIQLSQMQCREMAVANSEDLKRDENNIRKAELDKKIATAAFLPKIDGNVTAGYMVPDMDMMGMTLQMRGMYMAGISLTQPVFAGGRIVTGKKLAGIGVQSAELQRDLTRTDVIAEADNSYWSYITVASKVGVLESYMTQMDSLYNQTQTAVEAGMTIKNDLLRIEAKRSEIRYQWQKAMNGLDLCRLSLCRLLGLDDDTYIIPSDTQITVDAPALRQADISLRPEVQLLNKQIDANKLQVRMARAEMMPSVGFSAGYSYYGNIKLKSMADVGGGVYQPYTQQFKDGLGMFMLSVNVPLFSWGERYNKLKKAKADVENAELELQKNSKLMNLQVTQAEKNLNDAYLMIATAEKGLDQAKENLRVMKDRFEVSLSPLTDLLDAQSQWSQAESNLIEAKAQYKISQTEYLRALGLL